MVVPLAAPARNLAEAGVRRFAGGRLAGFRAIGQILALVDRAEADLAAGISVRRKPRVRRVVLDIAKGRKVRRSRAASPVASPAADRATSS